MARPNGIPNPFNPMDPDHKPRQPKKPKPTGKKQISRKILKTGSRKPKY